MVAPEVDSLVLPGGDTGLVAVPNIMIIFLSESVFVSLYKN